MRIPLLRKGPVGAAWLVFLLWAAPAAYALQDQTLRYKALYNGIKGAEFEVSIRNQEDGYEVVSNGKPSMVAKLFGVKTHDTVTRFVRHRGEVVLDSGSESFVGRKSYQRWFRFNRDQSRIEFSDGKHSAVEPGEHLEAAAFPLLLMLRPLEHLSGTRVRQVSAWRTRDYRYEEPVEEIVKTPAGEFSSWKIARYHIERPTDRVVIWLRREGDPIPLKTVVTRKRGTVTLLLTRG